MIILDNKNNNNIKNSIKIYKKKIFQIIIQFY